MTKEIVNWEDDYWKIVHEEGADYDRIAAFISACLYEQRDEERERIKNIIKRYYPDANLEETLCIHQIINEIDEP